MTQPTDHDFHRGSADAASRTGGGAPEISWVASRSEVGMRRTASRSVTIIENSYIWMTFTKSKVTEPIVDSDDLDGKPLWL
ncbi:hypothetical protein WJX64_00375 [Leifsonia sp. YIM 134122]|uniref:Uncharacterized protein n=1 Tax=Leifsonia stereocauli TaxID=3134136 RepID=A0ABU9VZ14_9MICO